MIIDTVAMVLIYFVTEPVFVHDDVRLSQIVRLFISCAVGDLWGQGHFNWFTRVEVDMAAANPDMLQGKSDIHASQLVAFNLHRGPPARPVRSQISHMQAEHSESLSPQRARHHTYTGGTGIQSECGLSLGWLFVAHWQALTTG